MTEPRFEWDPDKDALNQEKHGITFTEASTVFTDEEALLLFDPYHSDEEERFVLLGLSVRLRLLVVCHCYREDDNTMRIFSARKATKTERKQYDARKS